MWLGNVIELLSFFRLQPIRIQIFIVVKYRKYEKLFTFVLLSVPLNVFILSYKNYLLKSAAS